MSHSKEIKTLARKSIQLELNVIAEASKRNDRRVKEIIEISKESIQAMKELLNKYK